jgi:hypothetical protein
VFTISATDVSEEVGLEINIEKTKDMLLSCHQNAGKIRDIKIANRSFENISQFKYFGMTATNQNLIMEEIKRILNSVFFTINFRIFSCIICCKLQYIRLILPVVLYECET